MKFKYVTSKNFLRHLSYINETNKRTSKQIKYVKTMRKYIKLNSHFCFRVCRGETRDCYFNIPERRRRDSKHPGIKISYKRLRARFNFYFPHVQATCIGRDVFIINISRFYGSIKVQNSQNIKLIRLVCREVVQMSSLRMYMFPNIN